MKDMVGLNDGNDTVLVNVHTVDQCQPQPCCIHSPTQHHMAAWKPAWHDAYGNMWRRCPHGNLHPDPDDHNYWRTRNAHAARIRFTHVCDGCCQPPVTKEIEGGTSGGTVTPGA